MKAEAHVIARLIQENGELEIPSSGTSMRPLIREGDRCRFVPLTGSPRLGDILLVAGADGRLVGHRLIRVTGEGAAVRYICKGDSNVNPDAPAGPHQVIGTLTDIRKIRSVYHADEGAARLWGRLLVRWPGLSRIIRFYLRVERRMRRGKGGHAGVSRAFTARQAQDAGYDHPSRGKKRGSL